MLNLRKLKKEFGDVALKDGKRLYQANKVISAKILHLDTNILKISAQVLGKYKNTYVSQMEIDRSENETIDSNCDCPYHCDCQHLAAVLFYLEENLDKTLVDYSKDKSFEENEHARLLSAVQIAAHKEQERQQKTREDHLLQEYGESTHLLANDPFFSPHNQLAITQANLILLFSCRTEGDRDLIQTQLLLRLLSRSKPLQIPNPELFLASIQYEEPLEIGGKRYALGTQSFPDNEHPLIQTLLYRAIHPKPSNDKLLKFCFLSREHFGELLAQAQDMICNKRQGATSTSQNPRLHTLPGLFWETLETPLRFSETEAQIQMSLEYIHSPDSKILINPTFLIEGNSVPLEEGYLLGSSKVGLLHNQRTYYRFQLNLTRAHLNSLLPIRNMTIPEPLFGTFAHNSLPVLASFAKIHNQEVLDHFTTLPYTEPLKACCDLSFLDEELEATLSFCYADQTIPATSSLVQIEHLKKFVSKEGILARNLTQEQTLINDLFGDFEGVKDNPFATKNERKIIEFMTSTIPRHQEHVTFNCPHNLLNRFIYDKSHFSLTLTHTNRIDLYQMVLTVDGALSGISMEQLWDCLLSGKNYVEIARDQPRSKHKKERRLPTILVLDLEEMGGMIQLFDELGIEMIGNHTLERPIWTLANIKQEDFERFPVSYSISPQLKEIREQMLGKISLDPDPIPTTVQAKLRPYQQEGVDWLNRLCKMHLSGILADDMGLGKTLQAITALTQQREHSSQPSLIICPTSLLYNWKEELHKFTPHLKTLVVDGMPTQRKRTLAKLSTVDIVITSYSLLQKDIAIYMDHIFAYTILDEAQHIKNRGTRNAKSVKQIRSNHRMILSGTPIENSISDLWSLFDFLMPGFLGSYDRFGEKYIRSVDKQQTENLRYLRKKISPFILRRMKNDVLDDLPAMTENIYHTQLTEEQANIYHTYAQSARTKLTQLVEKEGFDRVQIHILATLSWLKQFCCHPTLVNEQHDGSSPAKYDMLLELLQTLIAGNHKIVIFSQYTRMLRVIRDQLKKSRICFSYLDGSSKNRLKIVQEFNQNQEIPVFLVSLKAGGTGLNICGADTVIHYDMWWNPAVENQATSRAHRIGQTSPVSVYKLVTLGTIEEKILEMQNRKKGLVKKIISCDDEALKRLTWEEVLELLQPPTTLKQTDNAAPK